METGGTSRLADQHGLISHGCDLVPRTHCGAKPGGVEAGGKRRIGWLGMTELVHASSIHLGGS